MLEMGRLICCAFLVGKDAMVGFASEVRCLIFGGDCDITPPYCFFDSYSFSIMCANNQFWHSFLRCNSKVFC